jgi:hypothetical protein
MTSEKAYLMHNEHKKFSTWVLLYNVTAYTFFTGYIKLAFFSSLKFKFYLRNLFLYWLIPFKY